MEAIEHKRSKASCQSFYRYFSKPTGKTVTIDDNASTYDTMRFLSEIAPKDAKKIKRYAKHLRDMELPLIDLCKVIWNDLFGCVAYEYDELGYEQVRSPERLVADAVGDCDCYTRFLNAVFYALGHPVLSRKADYGTGWQHVYIVVPKVASGFFDPKKPMKDLMGRDQYIVIDPVAEFFDTEKSYYRKFDSMAVLQSLEGYDTHRKYSNRLPDLAMAKSRNIDAYLPKVERYLPESPLKADRKTPHNNLFVIGSRPTNTELFNLHCSQIPVGLMVEFRSGLNGYDELGFFKKIGNAIKKGVDKIGDTAAGKVFKDARDGVRDTVDKIGDTAAGRLFRKVRDHVRDTASIVVKFMNRHFNPAAIILRNGFLMGMKLNIMNVSEKLRFAYLSDAQLKQMGFTDSNIGKLRSGRKRAEKIFEGAGGKSGNLKNAIVNGKGNKDGRVNLHAPIEASDDPNENRILSSAWEQVEILQFTPVQYIVEGGEEFLLNEKGEMIRLDDTMGEPASATIIAVASGAIAAVAALVQGVIIPSIQQKRQDELVEAQIEQIRANIYNTVPTGSMPPADSIPGNADEEPTKNSSNTLLGVSILGIAAIAAAYISKKNKQKAQKALSGTEGGKQTPKKPKRVVKTIDFSS